MRGRKAAVGGGGDEATGTVLGVWGPGQVWGRGRVTLLQRVQVHRAETLPKGQRRGGSAVPRQDLCPSAAGNRLLRAPCGAGGRKPCPDPSPAGTGTQLCVG